MLEDEIVAWEAQDGRSSILSSSIGVYYGTAIYGLLVFHLIFTLGIVWDSHVVKFHVVIEKVKLKLYLPFPGSCKTASDGSKQLKVLIKRIERFCDLQNYSSTSHGHKLGRKCNWLLVEWSASGFWHFNFVLRASRKFRWKANPSYCP